jgi:signal transduction histidine kinase
MAAKTEGERGAKEAVQSLMHDLLNPYTALSNLIQGWMLYPEDGEIREKIQQDWPELNRQIKGLLKAARHAEVETFSPHRKNILETAREGARLGSVKSPAVLRIVEEESAKVRDESWLVAHDSALLSRAVANLVRNSVEEGASRVEVWCERSPLSIHIRDNGPGIPTDKVCELFEGRLKSNKPDGSGIGFPTALRLIRLHGGKVLLEKSVEGRSGAYFRIDLRTLEMQS